MQLYRTIAGLLLSFSLMPLAGQAQIFRHDNNKYYVGEIGLGIGAANYYGDLNIHSGFQAVKPSAGLFFRYFFNSYFGGSFHLRYAQLGYSDVYNKKDTFQYKRNLSFNTTIWDLSVQGDFNFFRFEPGNPRYNFTPYLSLGIGFFHFNPYAYYQDQKYFLQPLGTEGQGSPLYPDRKLYKLWSVEVPVEIGFKYNLNRSWNLQLSASYHFTGTDYLDDVSTTYAGPGAFHSKGTSIQQIAAILQDRSGVYGAPIGEKGRQRGNSQSKDQYVLVQLSLSYLFTRYRCPF